MLLVRLFIASMFILGSSLVYAQSSDCDQTLTQATQEFTAGHFYGIPSLLNPCIAKLTKEQSIRAYLLLTQVYMVIDDPIAAEDSYLKLLRVDPEFVATEEKDPVDLVYLSKKFTTRPIFTPRSFVGINASVGRLISAINSDPVPIQTKQTYGLGFHLGAGLDWNLSDRLSLCTDFSYATKTMGVVNNNVSQIDVRKLTENQTWIDLPIYLRYSFESGRFRPYGYAGYVYNLLIGANGQASLQNNSENNLPPVSAEGAVPLLYKRNQSNRSLLLGIGSKYKIGKNFIYIDIRYMAGLSNLTKISTNFYNNDSQTLATSITQNRLIGDLFRVDNLSLSVGFAYPLYKPRKIKKFDSSGFFQRIRGRKKVTIKQ